MRRRATEQQQGGKSICQPPNSPVDTPQTSSRAALIPLWQFSSVFASCARNPAIRSNMSAFTVGSSPSMAVQRPACPKQKAADASADWKLRQPSTAAISSSAHDGASKPDLKPTFRNVDVSRGDVRDGAVRWRCSDQADQLAVQW